MLIWSRDRSALLSDLAPGARIEVEELDGDLFRVWLTTGPAPDVDRASRSTPVA